MSKLEWLFLGAGLLMYALGAAAGFAAARTGDRRRLAQARLAGGMAALYHLFVLVSLGARTGHFPVTGAEDGGAEVDHPARSVPYLAQALGLALHPLDHQHPAARELLPERDRPLAVVGADVEAEAGVEPARLHDP